MRKLIVPILIIFALVFAYRTEDPDAVVCSNSGGSVEVDVWPDGDEYRVCIKDDVILRVWKNEDGKNILVWGY